MMDEEPSIKGPEKLTEKEQEKAREEHEMGNHFDGLWDDWCRTGDHDYLRLYIRRGGDIDDQETRNLLASLIAPKNPGGSMPMENIRFYNHVRMLMDVEGMKKTAAINQVCKLEGIPNGWDRFKKGEELANKRY
jgi:hypothetical protein